MAGKKTGVLAGDLKTEIIKFRVTPDEKKELAARLGLMNMEMSEYIRKLIELDKKEGYICKY